MGELIEVIEPKEKEYLIKLSQSEVDFIQGIMADFLDNPQRKVRMIYHIDRDENVPSDRGMKVVKSIYTGLNEVPKSPDYDYFDYWDTTKYGEEYEGFDW